MDTDKAAIDANACPHCGAQVEGAEACGIWSGRLVTEDGRVFGNGLGYNAICKNCFADLEAFTIHELAQQRKFNWAIRDELGPHPPPRPTFKQEKSGLESVLTLLLEVHADRLKVVAGLKLEFVDFSEGSSQRAELKKWLFFDEVNEAAGRYPGILFHMGDITMTWLFFDSENRLQGYFIRPV